MPFNHLIGTLQLQSNGLLYSSTVFGMLTFDGEYLVQRGGDWLGHVPTSYYSM